MNYKWLWIYFCMYYLRLLYASLYIVHYFKTEYIFLYFTLIYTSANSLFGNVTNYYGNTYGDINATVTDIGGTIGFYTIHLLGTALPGFRSCNPPRLRMSQRPWDHKPLRRQSLSPWQGCCPCPLYFTLHGPEPDRLANDR